MSTTEYFKFKNHKELRKFLKKTRRKRIRQKAAIEREKEEIAKLNDPAYQIIQKQQENLEIIQKHRDELLHQEAEEKWLRDELLAQKQFREEQKRRQEMEAAKEMIRQKIQQEFEEQQEFEKKKREEMQRREHEKRERHQILMQNIKDYVGGKMLTLPEELNENAESNPGKPYCQFFLKTASCRFGDKCQSNHCRPGVSKIIVLRNFFQHILLEQYNHTEYGTDVCLEFSDAELQQDYSNFFTDVVSEIEKFAKIINFRTCSNYAAHLRGNVYVEFENLRDSLQAFIKLQGRFYAAKQINVEFCSLSSWKIAVCGLSFSKKCPKGRHCNFLHLFKNPNNKYNNPLNYEVCRKSPWEYVRRSWNEMDSPNIRRNWRWSDDEDSVAQGSITSRKNNDEFIRHRSRSKADSENKYKNRERKSSPNSEFERKFKRRDRSSERSSRRNSKTRSKHSTNSKNEKGGESRKRKEDSRSRSRLSSRHHKKKKKKSKSKKKN